MDQFLRRVLYGVQHCALHDILGLPPFSSVADITWPLLIHGRSAFCIFCFFGVFQHDRNTIDPVRTSGCVTARRRPLFTAPPVATTPQDQR
jgi:hypothetical protein